MVVHVQGGRGSVSVEALTELARALAEASRQTSRAAALEAVADAARVSTTADLAVVRVQTAPARLEAVAVSGPLAVAAEIEGTSLPLEELPSRRVDELAFAPACVRHAAERTAARAVLVLPIEGHATLELYRAIEAFDDAERAVADISAGHVALVLRGFADGTAAAATELAQPALELAGEALAAALDTTHTASEVARVAATVVGAPVGVLWQLEPDGELRRTGAYGLDESLDLERIKTLADAALADSGAVRPVASPGLPGGCGIAVGLPLGQPAVGLLQLLFAPDDEPDAEQLSRLTTFGVRAAHALRTSSRAQSLALELERTRTLLAVVGQATSELSLAHTLDTAVDLVADLLDVPSVALYLRAEDGRLTASAERGLTGPHVRVGERLLELALGRGGNPRARNP